MLARPSLDPQALVGLFFDQPKQLGELARCEAAQLPAPYDALLAHEHHMTVTVERHHEQTVHVDVLEVLESEGRYARKILLRRSSDNKVAQFGIVRLHLKSLPHDVQQQILSRQIPLGRVLIDHDVMRQVELVNVWRIAVGPELAEHFQVSEGTITYGRTAWIHFDDDAAVELLEIVAPVPIMN